MSGFGGFGSGGGFGSNTANKPAFGGFGSSAGGFGSTTNNTTNTGFGSNTGGSLFVASNNNNQQQASSGFGSGGAFGSTNTGGFGASNNTTTPFGANNNTGGGLFGGGNTASTNTFGGFGANNNAASTTSGFGATGTSTGGGLFGAANKPAFGSTTGTGFGSTNTTSAFGAPAATTSAFGSAALSNTATGECQGTGSVPFQPTVEKEPNSSTNAQNSFQSITFQQPYQKFSAEELRLADYAQGRKFGNNSGQPGAFGTSTGFGGGFGTNTTNTTSGFGSNTTANTGGMFGQNNAANTGGSLFGAANNTSNTTGGGLFGAKPATGGLFGSTPANTTNTTTTGGGLFGGGAGFGSNNTTTTGGFGSTTTGGGLFGNNNANNQQKPGFSFGNTAANTTSTPFGGSTTGGFGATNNTTSAFGSTNTTGGGLFGNNANTNQTQATSNPFGGGSAFGNNTAQTQQSGGLFGGAANNNQAKPSLFGASTTNTTGGGLFGNSTNTASTGAFGTANNTGGGLFGNNQQKPATTGGGLFGNTTTNTGSGGLFGGGLGNTQNQQNTQQGSSLFGGNTQQQKPSLFGSAAGGTTGGSLFGGAPAQQQGTSLFGGSTAQPQQQGSGSLFGGGNSLFGNSQQNQTQSLTASINDPNAFGNSIFSNLGSQKIENPGPIATPLSSRSKQKKNNVLPLYKLSPASSTRLGTPRRGYGFSYSAYGTPTASNSVSSTPGALGNSLLGQSIGPRLSKSMSASTLRSSLSSNALVPSESILAPGAFSATPTRQYGSTGSMKKLVINRSIRSDLFSPPKEPSSPSQNGILKKRVSFEANAGGSASSSTTSSPSNSNALARVDDKPNGFSSPLKNVQTSSNAPGPEELGYLRSSLRNSESVRSNGTSSPPQAESSTGSELAIVPEEEHPEPAAPFDKYADREPGQYWMKPTKQEIQAMNRTQRASVVGFKVGRENSGHIQFDVPVDLNNIDLDNLFDNIVVIHTREATVYPNASKKPPMGKGLNVPSTITLYNSWPRAKDRVTPIPDVSGPVFEKHLARLKRVRDTHFVSYDKDNGVWVFKVDHYTTYGLDYSDDEPEAPELDTESVSQDSPIGTQQLEDPFVSPPPPRGSQAYESDADDTFDFRKRSGNVLPGAFDNRVTYVEDVPEMEEVDDDESFLDERSVGSRSESGEDEPMDYDSHSERGSVRIEDQDMVGSFPQADTTAEHDGYPSDEDEVAPHTPGALVRARLNAKHNQSLIRNDFAPGNDWMDMLSRTVSPQKQDRQLLKSIMEEAGSPSEHASFNRKSVARNRVVSDGRGFATSIDLMNSLFDHPKSPKKSVKIAAKPKGFEWPYAKKTKSNYSLDDLNEKDRAFHESLKPSWGPDGTLVFAGPIAADTYGKSSRRRGDRDGLLVFQSDGIVSEVRDVHFAKFSNESVPNALATQKELTDVVVANGLPLASLKQGFEFKSFVRSDARDPASFHEKLVWELASVLFDAVDVPTELRDVPNVLERLRKDKLSSFWQKLVERETSSNIVMAKSCEEKAIACLAGHRIPDACSHLLTGKDYHLATLVPLIGGKASTRKSIREQLNEWQKSKVLSEFSQPIRAIYELLAGNVCVCDGAKTAPIEDRIESFVISQRFGLDWRQAFGLRLWYAILSSEPIERAVDKFAQDLEQDRETAKPLAWYVEQRVPTLWEDKDLEKREDLMWGLLKLYASKDANILASVLEPENSQLSPLDLRLSWQLSQTLLDSEKGSYCDDEDLTADRLTAGYAAQLNNEGQWLDAAFVMLHLRSESARVQSLQALLSQHAGRIGSEDSVAFTTLTQTLKIPVAWIWEAKALYMRSVLRDSKQEVECLLKAQLYDEAHRTFTKEVAPNAIIEQDYASLRKLLAGFNGKEDRIRDWRLGGEVYNDFLKLISFQSGGGHLDLQVVDRLIAALPAMVEENQHPAFLENVAVSEISDHLAKTVVDLGKGGKSSQLPKLLRLPLTEDKVLKHTVGMSLSYYQNMLSSARA